MPTDDLPDDLLRMVGPADTRSYAIATGWQRVEQVDRAALSFWLFNDPDGAPVQITVPRQATVDDYTRRIGDAVQRFAKREGRSTREVLTDLLTPNSDVLRFRIDAPGLTKGLVPIEEGISLFEGARKTILAAAHGAIEPRRFYPRLSRAEAEQFVSRCRLGQTERGSYTATVVCPLGLIHDREDVQAAPPFARRTTGTLMRSAGRLADALEAGTVDAIVRGEAEEAAPISANLCEAILEMQPPNEGASLTITCSWAKALTPIMGHGMPNRVSLRREHVPLIEELAQSLRPIHQPDRPQLYVGIVEALRGEPNADNQMRGEVVFAFQDPGSEQVLRARLELAPADYVSACDAHRDNHFVSLRATLRRGARVNRLEVYHDFRVMRE